MSYNTTRRIAVPRLPLHRPGELTKPLALPKIDPETQEGLDDDGLERLRLWLAFSDHFISSTPMMVEFCKLLPGFLTLDSEDQIAIVKYSVFTVWVLQVAKMSSDERIVFLDAATITKEQLVKLFDREFVKSLMNITETVRDLALDDDQISLFAAAVILNTENRTLEGASFIEEHRTNILHVLQLLMEKAYCSNSKVFIDLMALIPELENLRLKLSPHVEWFRQQNTDALPLDLLFKEIFNFVQMPTD